MLENLTVSFPTKIGVEYKVTFGFDNFTSHTFKIKINYFYSITKDSFVEVLFISCHLYIVMAIRPCVQ